MQEESLENSPERVSIPLHGGGRRPTEADLLRTLAAFARGRSVVIATHSETAMRWADTRLTLTAGGARLASEVTP